MIRNDLILFALELFLCLLLYFIAGFAEKNISKKWRILYAVPIVICIFLTALEGFESSMLGVYIGSVLLLAGFLREDKKTRRLSCVISAVLVLSALPVCLLNKGYRSISYTEDFKTAIGKMEQHYVLAKHKNIDFDALYDKYLPKFRQAENNHDEVENCIAWLEFCSEFHDGHVNFTPNGSYEEMFTAAYNRVLGNDYGLSLMTLSDGTTAAVNVDPALNAQGIFNGTTILSWDGKAPSELGHDTVKYCMGACDIDNENFWRTAFGAGEGGDSVTVAFLDENGTEKTAVLPKTGEPYYTRLKASMDIIDQGIETGHLMWEDINETTAALRIKMMMSDSESYQSGDHSALKLSLREKIDGLKARGIETIIFDMRGNSGGSGDMVKALASLFAPEGTHFYCIDGLWDDTAGGYAVDENGNYLKGTEVYFTGEDIWNGREIILLVNSSAISAADHLTKVMGQFDNVTVMGFTETNGSAQGVGGIKLESGFLSISGSLLLDKDGGILIDSGVDRQSGNKLEITVPFDKNAVKALFDEDRDYLLEMAVK
ncbi:MAG: peptidase S41 [Oscillospiraceae bacterium]|nr:peptidase S41 [Oscillospiraceae bacterium]